MLSAAPSSGKVNTMIRITGIGDHDRPEWLIRINGMHTRGQIQGQPAFTRAKDVLALGPLRFYHTFHNGGA